MVQLDDRQGDRARRDPRRGAREARARARRHRGARHRDRRGVPRRRSCTTMNSPRKAQPRISSAAASCASKSRNQAPPRRLPSRQRYAPRRRATVNGPRGATTQPARCASTLGDTDIALRLAGGVYHASIGDSDIALRIVSIDPPRARIRIGGIDETVTLAIDGGDHPSRPRRPELLIRRHDPCASNKTRHGRKRRTTDRADERPRRRGERHARRYRRGPAGAGRARSHEDGDALSCPSRPASKQCTLQPAGGSGRVGS